MHVLTPTLSKRLEPYLEILFGAAIGFTLFIAVHGWHTVNVYNTDWILSQGELTDTAQHFLGGMFYLRDSWHWPPFLVSGLALTEVNVLSVDAIPICALLFKLLYPVFFAGEIIQYLGVWGLFNFTMQGAMGALLCRRLIGNTGGRIAGVLFLVLSTPLWARFPIHTALSSHWLILWALWLWLHGPSRRILFQWMAVIVLSLLIHPYLTAIVGALFAAHMLQWLRNREKRGWAAAGTGLVFTAALFTLYLLGYFGADVPYGSWGGYGRASLNLNALINPFETANSQVFGIRPVAKYQGYEGFVFLGAGALALLFGYAGRLREWLRSPETRSRYFWLLLCCAGLTLFAVSNQVYLGDWNLLYIRLPHFIMGICHTFQASARFFWPVYYLIVLAAIRIASRDPVKWRGMAALGAACFLQMYDLGLGTVANQSKNTQVTDEKPYVPQLSGEAWDRAAEGKTWVFCPGGTLSQSEIGYYALRHHLSLYEFRLTRSSRRLRDRLLREAEALYLDGKCDPAPLYILDEKEYAALEPGLAAKFTRLGKWYVSQAEPRNPQLPTAKH